MNRYQILLLVILLSWPLVIFGILYLMSKLEDWVSRAGAESPEEAGLEPVAGSPPEKEVRIVLGDEVVDSPEDRGVDRAAAGAGGSEARSPERSEDVIGEASEDRAAEDSEGDVEPSAERMVRVKKR
jgi:hypothetical protein